MPPYGIDSLRNINFDAEGFFKSPVESTYDPAFGNLNYQTAYGPAPYTGNIPLTSYRVQPGIKYLSDDGTLRNLSYDGDIDNPSFGGSGNPRFNQFEPEEVATGIMKKASGFPLPKFDMTNLPMYEKDDEQDQEYIDQVNQSSNKFGGIMDLLMGIAIPGYGLFKNIAKGGLEGLKGFNQRLRQSDFGQSRTGAEYFMKRRERKQAERAQEAMSDVYDRARDEGFTNDRGGFSTNREDRAGTSVGSGQFSPKRSTGRSGY